MSEESSDQKLVDKNRFYRTSVTERVIDTNSLTPFGVFLTVMSQLVFYYKTGEVNAMKSDGLPGTSVRTSKVPFLRPKSLC